MRNSRLLPLLVMSAVATLVGCQSKREEEPVETTSETTRKTDDSSSSSKTETKELGENRESRTESSTDTPKGDTNTIEVLPEDCPPPPDDGGGGGDCPPNYELFLTSEGEFICGGPPGDDGSCEAGYVPDLTSEGELCVPE